jgi:hypothetical protein
VGKDRLEIRTCPERTRAGYQPTAGDCRRPCHNGSTRCTGGFITASTQLTVKNPDSVLRILSSQFTPIGAVDISGAASRLDKPAAITFRVDKNKYAADLGRAHPCRLCNAQPGIISSDSVDAAAGDYF